MLIRCCHPSHGLIIGLHLTISPHIYEHSYKMWLKLEVPFGCSQKKKLILKALQKSKPQYKQKAFCSFLFRSCKINTTPLPRRIERQYMDIAELDFQACPETPLGFLPQHWLKNKWFVTQEQYLLLYVHKIRHWMRFALLKSIRIFFYALLLSSCYLSY